MQAARKTSRILLIFSAALLVSLFSIRCTWQHRALRVQDLTTFPREEKIDRILRQMTLKEKVALLGGTGFTTTPIPRLGIPPMKMCDGPLGSRMKITPNGVEGGGVATNFSAPIAMAATWDANLIQKVGQAIGTEAKAKQFDIILAPCINIARVPVGGRTFEGFGEDPFLVSQMTVAYVKGVQSAGVIATTKHYVANNQEQFRTLASSNVSERALREIYFPAFKAAVQQGNTRAIMASYNKINGRYACANRYLLTDVLKNEWGFSGIVMSDWGAVHSTVPTANAGLDLEMPRGRYFNEKLIEAVKAKKVSLATIDSKVRRILRVMDESGLLGKKPKVYPSSVDTAAHRALALKTAEEAIVLLKNQNHLLPFQESRLHTLAVIGPNAAQAVLGGGGSGYLNSYLKISPLEGIRKRVKGKIEVRYVIGAPPEEAALPPIPSKWLVPPKNTGKKHGLLGVYFDNSDLKGKPVLTRIDSTIYFDWHGGSPGAPLRKDYFSARFTGFLIAPDSGTFKIGTVSDDGVRLFVNGKLLIDNWTIHGRRLDVATLHLKKGQRLPIRLDYFESRGRAMIELGLERVQLQQDLEKAVQLAKSSDAVVLCVGLNKHLEGEGRDRNSLKLPAKQEKLIRAVAAANPKTVVVLNNGTPIDMRNWLGAVPAVLDAWYTGQETGTALAAILFGDVNPSGKLPLTFPQKWEDCPVAKTYPGTKDSVSYKEGIYVGYRYYDKHRIAPLFPFGYGLSYTTFTYKELSVSPSSISKSDTFTVSLTVENSGRVEGDEIVELYTREANPVVDRPPKELKAFQRIHLAPGESRRVTFRIDAGKLAYFDPNQKTWVVPSDHYKILVGKSSRDIQLTGDLLVR